MLQTCPKLVTLIIPSNVNSLPPPLTTHRSQHTTTPNNLLNSTPLILPYSLPRTEPQSQEGAPLLRHIFAEKNMLPAPPFRYFAVVPPPLLAI
jgi:hypothetical protein